MADLKISQLTGATTPLAGTEVLPIVQSNTTKKVATDDLTVKNVRSNATTGLLQITGPAAASTRVMTTPDANFTVARTDAAQTFTGVQTMGSSAVIGGDSNSTAGLSVRGTNSNNGILRIGQTGKFYGFLGGDYQGVFEIYTESGAGDILFTVGGTTRGRMNSSGFKPIAGNGIDYSANTGAAGMTSQLLNWYEEGTWTPNQGAGLTLVGAFSSAGTYTRIGRQVFIRGSVSGATSVAVASAGAITTNLPYSAAADATGTAIDAANNASSILRVSSATLTAATAIAATTTITFSAVYSV